MRAGGAGGTSVAVAPDMGLTKQVPPRVGSIRRVQFAVSGSPAPALLQPGWARL